MSHPYNESRAHKVEKSRVHSLCRGGYAKGGAVHGDEAEDKKLIKKEVKSSALKEDGKKPKHRGDRVKRAKGGRVKHKSGKTNVNVIVAPKGGDGAPPMAGLGPKPPMPAMAPPPMAAKPPMPPMAGPPPGGPVPLQGAGAPPMPMRKKGGRVAHDTKKVTTSHKGKIEADPHFLPGPTTNNLSGPKTDTGGTKKNAASDARYEDNAFGKANVGRKKGGRVSENGGMNGSDKQGRTGIGFRLPVQHSGNKDDTQNIGRKKPVTYAKGGKVDQEERGGMKQYAKEVKFDSEQDGDGNKPAGGRKQYGDGWKTHAKPTNRATGGPIYADGKEGVGMGPAMHEGSRSGLGRIVKAHRATKINHV